MPNNKTNFLESTYKVSLDQAAWFVYAFLRQPELYRIATQEAIGGTIRKNSLKEDAGMVYLGSMGWFCRNVERPGKPENPDFPKLFMAFEDAQYNIHDVPHMPAGDDPIPYASKTFKYSGYLSEASVKEMLTNDEQTLPPDEDLKIRKVDLVDFLNNLPKDPLGRPYNAYPCSFFENRVNREMDTLLHTPGVSAIRYYFGYDDCDKYHCLSNRIRIIFIGVDSAGRNIPPTVTSNLASNSMLQNSWPPPPPY